MTDADASAVLDYARIAVAHAVRARTPHSSPPTAGLLGDPGAAFVTLRLKDGTLRGCIGRLFPDDPLGRTLAVMAKAASLEDPRFPDVTPDELPGLVVEVSVIGPFEDVTAPPDGIVIGEHGLRLRVDGRSGILLPQVAVEHGLDVERFLALVGRKAGVGDDGWRRRGARIQRFTAEIAGPVPVLDA
ncbi:MAG: AmmeMemoRadiSam system protein A [Planctomycetota bacterium]